MRGNGGFTLLELLLVCAMISLLVPLSFEIYSDVTARAWRDERQSDLFLEGARIEALLREDARRTTDLPATWGGLSRSPGCLILELTAAGREPRYVAYHRTPERPELLLRTTGTATGETFSTCLSRHLSTALFTGFRPGGEGGLLVQWSLVLQRRSAPYPPFEYVFEGSAAGRLQRGES
jgi:Tfp pilus assembly protein PilE